ncbi:RNA-guided pseudouridylation complex pseudouridine synthase subunit Cbf5 [Candidatus Micrarchaeota archaeon]|nr:RNA-guided pseudouridylation complex pseudouridine synthase subunit Cbf5 [Candidatus Micrarchaeota archaeon]MBD3418297.1 RNA-guided pseudouridylation complex pseudouridine synthase subunit Cbf5 [Candidatus Micrarchaeota archaeon]
MDVPELLDSGVVVLDKPCGPVSHEVTSWVKKLLGVKTGHAGTLDPDVSGVLPVALGRSTKLLKYIAGKRKTYVGICKFRKELKQEQIEDAFSKFRGEIEQTPPLISAVKQVKRKRFVHALEILEIERKRVLFRATVEAGTYIRTLCEDIGAAAGTEAFMEELRRTAVGRIREGAAHTMQVLADAHWLWKEKKDDSLLMKCIVPVDSLLHFRRVYVHENAAESLGKGAQLMAPGLAAAEPLIRKGEKVSIYTADRHVFVGVGVALFDGGEMNDKTRGKVVKSERIHFRA